MRLKLNLLNHCVETEIRSIYNTRVRTCLKRGFISADDEEIIELLKNMLETIDFPHLRSYLKESGNDAMLVRDNDNNVWIETNNQRIGIDGPWGIRVIKS